MTSIELSSRETNGNEGSALHPTECAPPFHSSGATLRLSPLQCALPKNRLLTPLECALPTSLDLTSFAMNTSKKNRGGGGSRFGTFSQKSPGGSAQTTKLCYNLPPRRTKLM